MPTTSKHLQIQGRSAKRIFIFQILSDIVPLFKQFIKHQFQNELKRTTKALQVIERNKLSSKKHDDKHKRIC